MGKKRLLNLAGALLGLAGLAYFAWMVRASNALRDVAELPPVLYWLFLVTGAPIALGTLSWACCFPAAPDSRRPSFGALFRIRLAGEAVNNALVSAYVAGEPVKGLLAARAGASPAAGLASALIGKTSFILGEVVFLMLSVVIGALLFGARAPAVTMLISTTAIGLAIATLGIFVQQKSVIFRGAKLLKALRLGSRRLWDRALPGAEAIDALVRDFYRERRGDFALSVVWAALGWTVGAVELWAFLHVVTPVEDPLPLALFLEAGVAVAKGLSFFVPGSVGVQEGGIAWLFELVGIGREAGLSYALFRRARELFWIGLGFAVLAWYLQRGRRARPSELAESAE
jgi:hypothetical protein